MDVMVKNRTLITSPGRVSGEMVYFNSQNKKDLIVSDTKNIFFPTDLATDEETKYKNGSIIKEPLSPEGHLPSLDIATSTCHVGCAATHIKEETLSTEEHLLNSVMPINCAQCPATHIIEDLLPAKERLPNPDISTSTCPVQCSTTHTIEELPSAVEHLPKLDISTSEL